MNEWKLEEVHNLLVGPPRDNACTSCMPNVARNLSQNFSSVVGLSSDYRRLRKTDLGEEAAVSYAFKRLSKTVSGHRCSAHMFNLKMPVLDAILNVVIVDVNMLTTLAVTFTAEKLNRRFIVAVDKYRASVVATVAELLKEAVELCGFLCRIRKCYILYLYC